MDKPAVIAAADTSLGIEFGSTRIKAVLIGHDHQPLATGGHEWKSSLVDGVWSYSLDQIWSGLQAAHADLAATVKATYGVDLERVGALGFSAMMHGYLAFDADGELLVPFRTWQNTFTGEAAGNPASMISTPSSTRASAISSFSASVIVAPGDCSPSRRVVSKIRIRRFSPPATSISALFDMELSTPAYAVPGFPRRRNGIIARKSLPTCSTGVLACSARMVRKLPRPVSFSESQFRANVPS